MELEISDSICPAPSSNTVMLVRERAVRRGITLGARSTSTSEQIRADERKVKQVLLNLLSNALKFTPEGGKIEVRAAVSDGVAEISVTDTGIGIAQRIRKRCSRSSGRWDGLKEGGRHRARPRHLTQVHRAPRRKDLGQEQVGSGSTFAFTLPLR
jgi:signal transduction histidine kinase